MKKLVVALGLLAGMAQAAKTVGLDVIIRDFSVDHPDFEAFDADYPSYGYARQCAEDAVKGKSNAIHSDGLSVLGATAICQDFKACYCPAGTVGCAQSAMPNAPLKYGMLKCGDVWTRGYMHELRARTDCKEDGGWWEKAVYVTAGMVQSRLAYGTVPPGADSAYYAYPVSTGPGRCHNDNFAQWFQDVPGINKRVEDVMTLDSIGNGRYEISADWNNAEKGYFPLDKYDLDGVADTTFGKQSLSIWCPAWDELYPGDNCNYWRNNGGPKSTTAAWATVAQIPALGSKIHNYGFTMAGVAKFKYNPDAQNGAGEIFEFVGDDDMWIFIDGQLVVDLGGTHTPSPAQINMNDVALARGGEAGGWTTGSLHTINFFYADRQTDDSNLKLKMSLSGLRPPVFGAPRILKASTVGAGATAVSHLYLSTQLDTASFRANFINTTANGFPIVVRRVDGSYAGYRATSIAFNSSGVDGYVYDVMGLLCTDVNCTQTSILNTGDSMSFNFAAVIGELENQFYLPEGSAIKVLSVKGQAVVQPSYGLNTTKLPDVDFTAVVENPKVTKPDFKVETMFTNGEVSKTAAAANATKFAPYTVDGGTAASTATSISGFGTASSSTLPSTRTGELILTTYPSGMVPSDIKGAYGLPPQASDATGTFGMVDPTVSNALGGVSFVKNGFSGESNTDGTLRVSPTRCTSNADGDINCLNFSLVANQPFKLNVTVFDHLGHFITQYRESVSEQEFRYVTQAANFVSSDAAPVPSSSCLAIDGTTVKYGAANAMTKNGYVKVNVNLYPFSQTGRRIGNGVYIVKIDRIDDAFTGCVNYSGAANTTTEAYVRYHDEEKFGWMRTSK